MTNQLTDTYLAYQFLKRLNTPFTSWDAYTQGVIDAEGNVIIRRSMLTPEQKAVWGRFDVLVANLKRLLAKVPGGNSKLATLAATVMLLKESDLDENNVDMLQECLDNHVAAMKEYQSMLPTSNLLEGLKILGSGSHQTPEGYLVPHKAEKYHESRAYGWAVTLKDKHDNQIGDTEYHYSKNDAETARKMLVKHHNLNEEVIEEVIEEGVKYKKIADDMWSVHKDGKHVGHLTTPSIDINQGKGKGTKAKKFYDFHAGTTPPKKNLWGYNSSKNRFETKDGVTRHAEHLAEDAPVSNVGGGAVAGLGVGPQGEPGRARKDQKKKKGELPTQSLFTRKSHG